MKKELSIQIVSMIKKQILLLVVEYVYGIKTQEKGCVEKWSHRILFILTTKSATIELVVLYKL
jgi:hypothetical protein